MTRRMWVLATAAWAAVVIAGSALTWLAIDHAGQQVTSEAATGATQPAVVGTAGSTPTATGTSTGGPSPSAEPSAGSTPTATTSTSPKASSPPRAETRTWSGAAGSVTASCTGRTPRLRGAYPNDGWLVEHDDDAESDGVEVKFEKNESEVKVRTTCVDGVPRFRVESDDD